MAALAGYLELGGNGRAPEACRSLLAALRPYGTGPGLQADLTGISLGCLPSRLLAEEEFDRQPLASGDGRFAILLDGRIDNRQELAASLGIEPARLTTICDARLMLESWQRWQISKFDRVMGDFAVAVWSAEGRCLILARGPLSLQPLFYCREGGMVAFASMPQAIASLPNVSKQLDWEALATLASGAAYRPENATLFRGIRKVLPGEAIEFADGAARSIKLWDLDRITILRGNANELGEALRDQFDRAVSDQLRRRQGGVACHLSAGRDSSAVTATAATLLRSSGEELIALTAAPRAGFADGAGGDWLVDESELAAETARGHPNVRHHICRQDGGAIEDQLDELHRHHFAPLVNLSNLPWGLQLTRLAAEEGASVLLTGANGNFSISNGGRGYLIDLLREEGVSAWWRQARRLGGTSTSEWLKLMHQVVAPWLPRSAYQLLRTIGGRATPASTPLLTLAQPLRHRAEAIRAAHFRDWRPARSYRALVKQTLGGIDDAQKFSQALWGVDIRDPTSDRRVVELCLSLPAGAMFSSNSDRPVYDAAFAGRLPPRVLSNRQRGYQCADWFERFSPARMRESFQRYLTNPLVREIVDSRQVDRMLDQWPTTGWQDSIVEPYRNQLIRTLAIASFVDTHFPA